VSKIVGAAIRDPHTQQRRLGGLRGSSRPRRRVHFHSDIGIIRAEAAKSLPAEIERIPLSD
jgi:hypothetical protein